MQDAEAREVARKKKAMILKIEPPSLKLWRVKHEYRKLNVESLGKNDDAVRWAQNFSRLKIAHDKLMIRVLSVFTPANTIIGRLLKVVKWSPC